jgi:hypothetical protein
MQFTGNRRTAEQMIEGVRGLDLEPIKFKLMDAAEGEGWTREFVERTEVQYRRFLALLAKYPHEPIAPGKDVDRFWHAHILDTQKYTEDCDRVFGRYLHHFPYFGMRGADDAAALAAAGARTLELYAAEFAPAATGGWNGATPTGGAFCSVAGQSFCSVAGAGHIDTVTRPRPAPIA